MDKKVSAALVFALLASTNLKAQSIIYPDLSYNFIFKIRLVKPVKNIAINKGSKLILSIFNRNNELIQKINTKTDVLFEDAYINIQNSRSYITGKNKEAEVFDYDFGDIVVADFNFDGREDIAVKYDSGGNGGPVYNFYVQDSRNHFHIDRYLTDSVASFPEYINIKQKKLVTQIHANVHQERKKTFKYNIKTKKWRLINCINVNS